MRALALLGDLMALACAVQLVAAARFPDLWPTAAFLGLGAFLVLKLASILRR